MVEPSSSQKENAPINPPLKQTTLLSALDKGFAKGRKRTITLVNGDEVDLTASIPVLDAMRLRIIQLEDELATPPPAKRATTAASASAVASASTTAAPTASSGKADEKKRKMQVKKIFDSIWSFSLKEVTSVLTSFLADNPIFFNAGVTPTEVVPARVKGDVYAPRPSTSTTGGFNQRTASCRIHARWRNVEGILNVADRDDSGPIALLDGGSQKSVCARPTVASASKFLWDIPWVKRFLVCCVQASTCAFSDLEIYKSPYCKKKHELQEGIIDIRECGRSPESISDEPGGTVIQGGNGHPHVDGDGRIFT
ncbi:hypothetical protein B0H13DRAFT_2439840 [Mycena leptocephala]|nr:hypothetical protein B0H13DRAFT_2439840 [Mycena leptocephala]